MLYNARFTERTSTRRSVQFWTNEGRQCRFLQGCYSKLVDLLNSTRTWVIVVAVVILVIEVIRSVMFVLDSSNRGFVCLSLSLPLSYLPSSLHLHCVVVRERTPSIIHRKTSASERITTAKTSKTVLSIEQRMFCRTSLFFGFFPMRINGIQIYFCSHSPLASKSTTNIFAQLCSSFSLSLSPLHPVPLH